MTEPDTSRSDSDADAGYGLGRRAGCDHIEAPDLPYRPPSLAEEAPGIGLIGCGGITEHHLRAYRAAGYPVLALCDPDLARAEERRTAFYLDAALFRDHRALLAHPGIEVVDIATHPDVRAAIIEDALRAGLHVLSQKPFVLDLDVGKRLVDLADAAGLVLAVNQNGRWAPHLAWMRAACEAGLIGPIESVEVSIHWDHGWVVGTPFDDVEHLVLFDFGIHWFDFVSSLFPGVARERVFACVARSLSQRCRQPLLAEVVIETAAGRARLLFNGASANFQEDRTVVVGSAATVVSFGPDLQQQTVSLHTPTGIARPQLVGSWFPDGFHGAMAELLSALEQGRPPLNAARQNLDGLALCFAACASSKDARWHHPGDVWRLPG